MSIFDYKNSFKDIEQIPCPLIWESHDHPKNPEVSIVMPIYSNHKYFKLALESALSQDWNGVYEVVVVDNYTAENNPNQKIVEELKDPRVRYFRNSENIGVVGNWNRCIMKAEAPLLTFLHDDDMFMPTTLSTIMNISSKYPGKLVISTLRPIDRTGNTKDEDNEYALTRKFLLFKPREVAKVSLARALCLNIGNCEGALFSKDILISIGGFHLESYPILDYELLVRYCYKCGAVMTRKPNVLYRFADNDSYKVYSSIAPKQHEVAEDMIKKISLPEWITNKIIDTHCKDVDTNYRRSFAPPEHQVTHHVSKFDRRLTMLYRNILNLLEAYQIAIWK